MLARHDMETGSICLGQVKRSTTADIDFLVIGCFREHQLFHRGKFLYVQFLSNGSMQLLTRIFESIVQKDVADRRLPAPRERGT